MRARGVVGSVRQLADALTMASPEVDFDEIEQGATFTFSTSWGSRAEDANGDAVLDGDDNAATLPYDLTGCHARMQFRFKQPTDVLVTCTDATPDPDDLTIGGITLVTDAPAGATISHVLVSSHVLTFTVDDSSSFEVGEVVASDAAAAEGNFLVTAIADGTHVTVAAPLAANANVSASGALAHTSWDNIEVIVTDEKTDALTFKACVYDLKVYWPDGSEDFVLNGKTTVRLRVTQDASA